MSTTPLRGQVFRVDLGHGAKPWLIVSNNARNRNLETVLAVRVTTTSKHATVPTVVPLSPADPLTGYIVVDELIQLYRDELTVPLGAVSVPTMRAVRRDSHRLAVTLAVRDHRSLIHRHTEP